MLEEREVLALGVASWDRRDHGARRVDSGLFAQEVIGDVGVSNPNVHLTTDGGAEDATVLVGELLHGEPWAVGVDIVDASNVGDGRGGAWDQLQAWRRSVFEHVLDELDGGDEDKDAGANEPLVGANGSGGWGVEKSVSGGLVGGTEIVLDLGHNDRRRD